MRYLSILLVGLCAVMMAMASPVEKKQELNKEQVNALREVSDSLGSFSIKFFKEISKQKPGENLISSPLSADVVLSMSAFGAAGNTEKQMKEGLNLKADKGVLRLGFQTLLDQFNNVENVTLELANKMYLAKGLKLNPEFKELTKGTFRSEANEIDFSKSSEAANTVNSWVREKTHDKIDKIIKEDDVDATTRMILLNAVYFKGNWAKKFKTEDTQDRPFHLNEKESKKVPTMFVAGNFHYGELPDLKAKFIELPYSNDNLKMVIIVPDEVNGLEYLVQNLEAINATRMTKSGYSRDVQLYLPKFKVESEIDLKEPLQKLGMTDMFENTADFSGISKEPLKIGKVLQKAFIEVNEEGSEAAAVTAVHIVPLSLPVWKPKPIILDINRPFVFRIFDTRTKLTIFSGSIYKP